MDATRCSESSRDREERLRRRRERERARRAAEMAEQRARRLWQRRERDRARRALQSSERELQRMRATSHDRLTAETGSPTCACYDRPVMLELHACTCMLLYNCKLTDKGACQVSSHSNSVVAFSWYSLRITSLHRHT